MRTANQGGSPWLEELALILIVSSLLMTSAVSAQNTGFSQDEIAIRKAAESYVAAYNSGDASAVASHWSRNGAYLYPDRRRG